MSRTAIGATTARPLLVDRQPQHRRLGGGEGRAQQPARDPVRLAELADQGRTAPGRVARDAAAHREALVLQDDVLPGQVGQHVEDRLDAAALDRQLGQPPIDLLRALVHLRAVVDDRAGDALLEIGQVRRRAAAPAAAVRPSRQAGAPRG